MITKLENGNAQIEEYSFADFLNLFQQAVLEGYRLDLESNDNFPQKYGSHMTAILVKEVEVKPVEEAKPVIEVEVKPMVSPVRRKRSE